MAATPGVEPGISIKLLCAETASASIYAIACGATAIGMCVSAPPAGLILVDPHAAHAEVLHQAVRAAGRLVEGQARQRGWPARGYYTNRPPSASGTCPDGTPGAAAVSAYLSLDRAALEQPGGLQALGLHLDRDELWYVWFGAAHPRIDAGLEPPAAVARATAHAVDQLVPGMLALEPDLDPVSAGPGPSGWGGGWASELAFTVRDEERGITVPSLIIGRGGVSRSLWRAISRTGYVLCNGLPVPADRRLLPGDRVEVVLPAAERTAIQPEPAPLVVVYEDQDLLIVDKPPGVLTHPAHGRVSGTLGNWVLAYLEGSGGQAVVRPVSRLDRGTSGLVAFARTRYAHQALARQRVGGGFRRDYLAITAAGQSGSSALRLPDEFTITEPIVSPPGHPERYATPRPATTAVRVLGRLPQGWLVTASPRTGRTHQVRQHLTAKGLPLYGDASYGGPAWPAAQERLALHAWQLSFTHPVTGAPLLVRARLPQDMRRLLSQLRRSPKDAACDEGETLDV